jgi:3-dehydroquinate dehydratase
MNEYIKFITEITGCKYFVTNETEHFEKTTNIIEILKYIACNISNDDSKISIVFKTTKTMYFFDWIDKDKKKVVVILHKNNNVTATNIMLNDASIKNNKKMIECLLNNEHICIYCKKLIFTNKTFCKSCYNCYCQNCLNKIIADGDSIIAKYICCEANINMHCS